MTQLSVDTLNAFLWQQIPLAQHMRAHVSHFDGTALCLEAPLEANINPHGTAFAGSQSTLGILSGWALLYARLQESHSPAKLVIKDSQFNFQQPVTTDLWAKTTLPDDQFLPFLHELHLNDRAHLMLTSQIGCTTGVCGSHTGRFVALAAP